MIVGEYLHFYVDEVAVVKLRFNVQYRKLVSFESFFVRVVEYLKIDDFPALAFDLQGV